MPRFWVFANHPRNAGLPFNHINEKGGCTGDASNFIVYDDEYDPPRSEANTRKLIYEDKVFALTGLVGTPTALRIIPLLREARVPAIGLFSPRYLSCVKPFQRYVINIRASYRQEVEKVLEHLVTDRQFTRIAVFYQDDEYGHDGLEGTRLALRRYGLEPVATGLTNGGGWMLKAAVGSIFEVSPQAVVMIGTYGPCAKFIQLARKRHPCTVFHNVSFVGPEELVKRLGAEAEGVIITQVVPPPWETALLPAAEEYTSLLRRYFP